MICYCPFCSSTLPETLIDGVTFCQKCSRIINSTKQNELVSAYRLLVKNQYSNMTQFKTHLRLSKNDFDLLIDCFENEDLSVEEFEKKIKAGV